MLHIKLIPCLYYDSDIILANITKTSLNLPGNSNISDALVSLKTEQAKSSGGRSSFEKLIMGGYSLWV